MSGWTWPKPEKEMNESRLLGKRAFVHWGSCCVKSKHELFSWTSPADDVILLQILQTQGGWWWRRVIKLLLWNHCSLRFLRLGKAARCPYLKAGAEGAVIVVLGKNGRRRCVTATHPSLYTLHTVQLPREAQEDSRVDNGATSSRSIGSKGLRLTPCGQTGD